MKKGKTEKRSQTSLPTAPGTLWQKTAILIDEFGVPLGKAYQRGYYDQMILLIRQLLNAVLKTNDLAACGVCGFPGKASLSG